MLEPAPNLRRAVEVQTAPGHTLVAFNQTRRPRHLRAALRTNLRKTEGNFLSLTFRQHHIHNGRNDFACLFDCDGVADANVLLPDVVLIVQRGAANGAPRQKNRLEFSDWCELARATHLNGDAFEQRLGLFSGVFVGNRPTRSFGGKPGLLALCKVVQLDHGPIGFVTELAPHLI